MRPHPNNTLIHRQWHPVFPIQDIGRSRAINTDESNHTTGGAQRIFVKCGLIAIHGLTNST
ncbi:hypothetical protein DPMN_161077 [Dreissena polymorpha]|uniref:Uncharacterized protein n=1 Tax=Dreissena polymorpha TaxID=45954 RepID=A0A9D4EPC0_DREPO|nr:hypothetical protein DPMN_161077 [Dreissena polymorpha]